MIEVATLAGDGSFQAYMAEPEADPRAAIIVIQEIFGVNEGIRRKCDGWAEKGYLAMAPDLFWRLEPGVELDPDVQSFVERLERAADSEDAQDPSDLPSGDVLAREFQRFLRQRGPE